MKLSKLREIIREEIQQLREETLQEDILDTITDKLFGWLGKRQMKKVLKQMKRNNPEMADSLEKLEKDQERIEKKLKTTQGKKDFIDRYGIEVWDMLT